MKKNAIIIGCLLLAVLQSCKEERFDILSKGRPSVEGIIYSVAPLEDSPNTIRFSFSDDNKLVSPIWKIEKPDGTFLNSTKRDFTMKYLIQGEYNGFIRVFGQGGLSTDSVGFKFYVTESDSLIWKLTGKDGQKVWIWDSTVAGHLACGWVSSESPDWWITEPNELRNLQIYDDEMRFLPDKTYLLEAHGYIYVNESALSVMDPINYPNGGSIAAAVAYTPPKGQQWSMYQNEDGTLCLSFSEGAFPSYVASPEVLLGTDYEVLELTNDILYLRWKDWSVETSWYYRFKVKT